MCIFHNWTKWSQLKDEFWIYYETLTGFSRTANPIWIDAGSGNIKTTETYQVRVCKICGKQENKKVWR